MKALPMAVMAAGSFGAKDKVTLLLEKVRVATVQAEVNSISHYVYNLSNFGESLPDPNQFETFLRNHMDVKTNRDPSKDFWGTTYKLHVEATRFLVWSAGPDKTFGTKDDVYAQQRLR